jgi:hypothetical protein
MRKRGEQKIKTEIETSRERERERERVGFVCEGK